MADTGPPWELPYPLPTDLVRDGADAIKDLAEATADALDDARRLVKVHHTQFDGIFSTSSSTYQVITGFTNTFTPEDGSHRLLVMFDVTLSGVASNVTDNKQDVAPFRDGLNLLTPAAPGGRRITAIAWNSNGLVGPDRTLLGVSGTLDVPAVAAVSTTFDVRTSVVGTTGHINRTTNDSNDSRFSRSVSTLTILEYQP